MSSASAALARVRSARLAGAAWPVRGLRSPFAVAAGFAILVAAAWVPRHFLSADDSLYLSIAESLLAGRGLAMPNGEPVAFRPPLYVLALLPGYAVAGIPGAVVTNILAAALAAAAVALIGWRLGGMLAATLAVLLAFAEVDVLQIAHSLRIDASVTAALLVSALITVRAIERPRLATGVALGVALGVAVLLKLTAAAFLPVPLIAAYWARRGSQRLARLRVVLVGYLVFVAVLTPWWVWLFLTTGRVYLLPVAPATFAAAAVACVLVGVVALVASSRRFFGTALAPVVGRLEGAGALTATVVGSLGWGILMLAAQFVTEGVQDPSALLREVVRSTLFRFEPFLWPVPLAVASWLYALYRLPGRRPVELVAALSLLSFVPVATFVGVSFYDPRSALPFFVFSALWEAAVVVRVVVAVQRAARDRVRARDERDGVDPGRERRFLDRIRRRAGVAILGALAVAAVVALVATSGARLVERASQVAAEDIPDERPEFDWRTSVVGDVSAWLESNVPAGSVVMTSWLYGAEIHRQTDARYVMPYVPTVEVALARTGPLFEAVSTGPRFDEGAFDPAIVGDDWLFLRKHAHGPYTGLTQASLLAELRASGAQYLIVTGEHPVRSTLTLTSYVGSHPAFRELHVSRLPSGRAGAHVYAVDQAALAPADRPPAIYDPPVLEALAHDVPRVRLGWTQQEFLEALGGERIVVVPVASRPGMALAVPALDPPDNYASSNLGGAIAATASLLTMAAWFLLPGLPVALLWRRTRRLDALDTLVLALLLSIAIGTAVAGALVALGELDARDLVLGLAAAGIVAWVTLLALQVRSLRTARDAGLPSPGVPAPPNAISRSRAPASEWIGSRRLPLLLAGAFVLLLLPQLLASFPNGLPRSTTSWYYWNLSRTMATSGGLPAGVLEWGQPREFKADYVPFSVHLAGAETLDEMGFATLETYRLFLVVGAALAVVAFARRWSLPAGVLLAAVFVSTNLWTNKFGAIRPESFALLLLIGALWALDRGWTAPSRADKLAWGALAGVLGGLVAASHLEVFVVGGAVGLALIVFDGRGASRVRWATAVLALAVATVVAGATFAAAGSGLPGAGELGTRSEGAGDVTWRLYTAIVGEGGTEPPPATWTHERVMAATARFPWFQLDILDPLRLALLLALVGTAVTAVAAARAPAPRRLLAFGACVFLLLVLGSLVTFEAFETYVPRRIGPRRFLPYAVLGLAAVMTAGALVGVEALRRRLGRAPRPDAPPGARPGRLGSAAGLASLALVLAVLVAPGWLDRLRDRPRSPLSPTGRDAYLWIAEHAPPDARVLVNGYTDGVVAALARRPGIVDGRAPYGEDPEWVAQAIRDADAARAFFLAPTDAGLAALDPDYLVVGPAGELATAASYPAQTDRLAQLRGLRRAATFGDVTVYEVTEAGT